LNENIKQLAIQAGLLSDEVPDWMCEDDKEKIENFAKLLIIEYRTQMIDTVQKFKDAPWEDNVYPAEPMVVSLSWVVQKHFGFGIELGVEDEREY
jgi:hypothetical protein